ncbi:MAG: hypothetical protein HYX27_03290 [Acidobacteria bacterium]|nr:hypothetical protein [Acidobacteriota bacterium]
MTLARFPYSNPILEIASLVLVFVVAFLGLTILVTWLPFVAQQAGWGSRPYPPSRDELELAGCRNGWLQVPILALAILSPLLRLTWLRSGRKYGWLEASGRTIFDHAVLTFLAGVLIYNAAANPLKFRLTTELDRQCESIPRDHTRSPP